MSSTSSTTASATTDRGSRFKGLAGLQRLGRSLMLPIAALPAAALLLRLGQPDLLGEEGLGQFADWLLPVAAVVGAAGGAIFSNLPLIFAVGVAIGLARKSDGSTALAAVIGYVVLEGVFEAMAPYVNGAPSEDALAEGAVQEPINYGVLGGILIGVLAARLWQRYYRVKLPDYLAFFGGRRFVPIITAFAAIVLGVVMALLYPLFDYLLTNLGEALTGSAVVGGGLFGFFNRLLIPLGVHHILNSLLWFQVGEYEDTQGDLTRFFAGDPEAGIFMTGFFPIMMFALPAAALAIAHTARPRQKKAVLGIMSAAALTSFVTGITEPIEFAFLFVAWPLYLIHALLTGVSMALVNGLDIHHGFGFSAGAIDYVLNFGIAQKPLLLIPIGLAFAVLYYFLFRWVIVKWNLRTTGREEDDDVEGDPTDPGRDDSSGRTSVDRAAERSRAQRAGADDAAASQRE
ncbi:MAG: PTS transporter subunit EIIC [Actinomycetota bacterium]|nr:PTS transporter subunit EIIC [Actinomycetota bacterium]